MTEFLTPPPQGRHRPSRPLRALQGALSARPATGGRQVDADVLRLTSALRVLEGTSGQDVVSLLEDLAALAAPVDAGGRSGLNAEQESALRRTGSLVDELPPFAERASTLTVMRRRELLAGSLTTAELARALRVTPGRIRQRVTARTLYGVRTPSGLRFPLFQLLDGAELPGWAVVAPRLPPDAHPVAVERFMNMAHIDLPFDEAAVSPRQWLATGNPPEPVAALASQAFTLA